MTDAELEIAQSPRHGAPMTLVRGGEERDLAAIAAMGESRAPPFRFHLDRDVDFVRYAILSALPSPEVVMVRSLGSPATHLRLTGDEVLLWHGDI